MRRSSFILRCGVAVAALSTFSADRAQAKWQTVSLPGVTSGDTVGIVAGIGGATVAALIYYKKHHHPREGLVEVPAKVQFTRATTDTTLTIRAKDESVNFAELSLKGKGFTVKGGGPELPLLLKPGQPFELKITRTPGSSRGEVDLTFLDHAGKSHSMAVALQASRK